MLTRKDFEGKERPTWCPGCGNFGILNAVKMALAEHNIAPHEILIVTGIGCGSKLPHYMKVNGFHTLHGRPVAVATGARLADHGLRVMVVHGDGDGYGEGLSSLSQRRPAQHQHRAPGAGKPGLRPDAGPVIPQQRAGQAHAHHAGGIHRRASAAAGDGYQ